MLISSDCFKKNSEFMNDNCMVRLLNNYIDDLQ